MKNNLGLKIIALLMAIFIWLQITLVSQHQSKVGMNLILLNPTEGDTLHHAPAKISSTVEGRGLDILRLKFSKTQIQMEAADYWAGNSLVYQVKDLPGNIKVRVVGITPPTLAQRAKARELANGKTNSSSDMEAPPALGNAPSGDSAEDSSDKIQTRILTDLPITTPPGTTIFPTKVTLKVRGKTSLLEKLPAGVSVRLSAQQDYRGQFNLETQLPEGVTLLDLTPRQVRAGQ